MGKKKTISYVSKNLENFAKFLQRMRRKIQGKESYSNINLDALQNAIKSLPKTDRENIERFFGLTGGPNHSKKKASNKDIAFIRMRESALESIYKLFFIDYMFIYDEEVRTMMYEIYKKINKKDIEISELEAIKYLMAFVLILQNGPKMIFEKDEEVLNEADNNDLLMFDEYSLITEMHSDLKKLCDNCLNLGLLITWIEMIDFKEKLTIKKTFRITIPKEYKFQEIKAMSTFSEIRNFKEKLFPYGPWEVCNELLFSDNEIDVKELMNNLSVIRNDWSKVKELKTGEKKLKTLHENRTLKIYKIGKLEFTDIYELMVIYLARDFIAS